VDHLPVRVEDARDADFLAFVLFRQILAVDIVRVAAVGILQHILVTRLHDCARESLGIRRL